MLKCLNCPWTSRFFSPSFTLFTMTASRTDLLAWLNDLLQINYTKVEQCGSGGAYCQVLDSVYGAQSSLPACDCELTFHMLLVFLRRCTDESSQNECEARIRIYCKFQSDAKYFQVQEDRKSVFCISYVKKTRIFWHGKPFKAHPHWEARQVQNAVRDCRFYRLVTPNQFRIAGIT